jgi:hypothetical protein
VVVTDDYKYINTTISYFNDEIHHTVANYTLNLNYDLEQIQGLLIIRIPENDNDARYKLEVFRTSVDGNKFLAGRSGSNFTMKTILNNYKSAAVLMSQNFHGKRLFFFLV